MKLFEISFNIKPVLHIKYEYIKVSCDHWSELLNNTISICWIWHEANMVTSNKSVYTLARKHEYVGYK